jgi:hypothetical protein
VYVGEIELQKEVQLVSCRDEFAKEIKQNIWKGSKSHFHLLDGFYGTNKIDFMFRKGSLGMCSQRNVTMDPLWAMVVQRAP